MNEYKLRIVGTEVVYVMKDALWYGFHELKEWELLYSVEMGDSVD